MKDHAKLLDIVFYCVESFGTKFLWLHHLDIFTPNPLIYILSKWIKSINLMPGPTKKECV